MYGPTKEDMRFLLRLAIFGAVAAVTLIVSAAVGLTLFAINHVTIAW